MSDIWGNFRDGAMKSVDEWIWRTRSLQEAAKEHESPIEQVLAAAIKFDWMLRGGPVKSEMPTDEDHERCKRTSLLETFIVAQHRIGPYRADLIVGWIGAGSLRQSAIVVECDGHQWHERTKEQAASDRARERDLNSHVATVIRFTGSEIFRDPFRCARDVAGIMEKILLARFS